MAKQPHANSRRLYWWESHISSKNSRWLQENLTDMDAKVKSMIKLIEEDADSFARRAEMYYKKRPELTKMVEEFYRAYRALAERYDHATGALRQAHKTITEAFPNHDPSGLTVDELAPDDEYTEDRKGLKQFNESFGSGDDGKLGGRKVKRGLIFDEAGEKEDQSTQNTLKLEKEIQRLKDALAKFEAEKKSSFEKLSRQELESSNIRDQEKKKAEVEVESLKIALKELENEKETSLVEYQKCIERIKDMDDTISCAQKSILDLNERAQKAEAEAQSLKLDLANLESEKATSIDQCKQSLEKIFALENKLVLAEEEAKKLKERAKEAETEVETLKKALEELGVEKETNAIQHQQFLDTISTLEKKVSCAEEEVRMLNGEIENGVVKLMGAKEKCVLLEKSNQSLHFELESLKLKISDQSQELVQKKGEIGILWASIQEERLRFLEAETAFQTLQLLHAQTEEEMKSLALELQNKSLIISDLETRNQILLNESLKFKEEIKNLNELNLASSVSITSMRNEIISLSETKLKLEVEVELRVDERNALQQDIYCLKEELNDLNKKYLAMWDEVKDLQDENSNLKVIQDREMREKVDLLGKLEHLEKVVEEKAFLEKSLFDLSTDLKEVKEEKLALEKSLKSVSEEKLTLILEKDVIETQLQVATENLEKISEKNTFMENSISDAHDEIEGLNIRLKSFEESCQVLENEKSDLTNEKVTLVSLVEITRERLENLEKKYRALEENYAVLEKQKESALCEVDELRSTVEESTFREEKQMTEIENLRGKVEGLNVRLKSFEDLCQILENEKSNLSNEKVSLVSQVEITRERLEDFEEKYRALEENYAVLEKQKESALCEVDELRSTVEESTFREEKQMTEIENLRGKVEGLNVRLKSFEDLCQILENEKSNLSNEKVSLVSQVEITRERLEDFEEKYRALEENYAVLEKQKESALCEVDELRSTVEESSFREEKQMTEIENLRGKVEGLNVRLKSFEDLYQILENEKSNLSNEKVSLVSQVEITRERLEDLEEKYRALEENYAVLEKQKESALCEVDELRSTVEESTFREEKQMTEIENLRGKVEGLNVRLKSFEESCQILENEKSDLSNEKVTLVSHIEITRERLENFEKMYRALEENYAVLEKQKESALCEVGELRSTVKEDKCKEEKQMIEIENLRGKVEELNIRLKSFEESCQILENEKSDLSNEKVTLVSQIEITRERLVNFEKIYRALEENYAVLEKQKESALCEVDELQSTVKEDKFKEEKQMIEIENLRGKVLDLQTTRVTLEEENLKLVHEKISLVKDFLHLQEKNNSLEAENLLILGETAVFSNLSLIFKNIINEKSLEIEELRSTVDKLQVLNVDFEDKISVLQDKLVEAQLENMDLKNTSATLEEENLKLVHEKISLVKDFLDLQEKNNSLEAENLLIIGETAFFSNLSLIFKNFINEKSLEIEELRSTVDKLQVLGVEFEDKISALQGKLVEAQLENLDLNNLLKKTESSFSAITLLNLQLNLEIENGKDLLCQMETEISKAKCKVYDTENEKLELQDIISDLKQKNDEIKILWEFEATNLTSELHTLFVLRALLEEKFQELIGLLKFLENEANSKDRGIELLEERISTLEGKNGEIVAQLAKYVLAINSLMDSISSLENTTCLHIQLQDGNHEKLEVATENHVVSHEESKAIQKDMNNLSELHDLERRIKAVERTIHETNSRLEAVTREIKELGSEGNENSTMPTQKGFDFDSGEIVEKELGIDKLAIAKRFSLPNQELDKTKILERLNSDCEKLTNLQITVQDLKSKMEINNDKTIKIKSFGENGSLEGELVKAEEDIMQLFDLNGKLMKKVDNFDDVKEGENRNLRRKFSEQARKVSERIGQLQLEVQKIQFIVLKMVRDGKDKAERKSKSTSLRDYLGLRSRNGENKRTFCGCVHRPSAED